MTTPALTRFGKAAVLSVERRATLGNPVVPFVPHSSSNLAQVSGKHPRMGKSATLSTTRLAVASTVARGLTPAPSVVRRDILPSAAQSSDFLRIVTPLRWSQWRDMLECAGALEQFHDVPVGIRDGFRLGVAGPVSSTYIPENHKSATSNPLIIKRHIEIEVSAGRYTGPFHPERLEQLIGPFRTSPLGTVPKAGSDGFRIIQDLSFPRNDPLLSSVNSEIDPALFQCEWGTFADCVLRVVNAPPGTQAAIFDVDSAYRRIPISPLDQPHIVAMWQGLVWINHDACFGAVSSTGIFGRPADAIVVIFKFAGVDDLLKWVDDYVFFRFPIAVSLAGVYSYSYDESLIFNIASELGWPWATKKHFPFAFKFVYLGFLWDLEDKTVEIPLAKREKFLAKISGWSDSAKVSRKDCESVIGSLNHCCLVITDGRSRMPSLYKFCASFARSSNRFTRHCIPATVLADVQWWRVVLSRVWCGLRLVCAPTPLDFGIYVDASTSFGIGLLIDGKWAAWRLKSGWDSDGRDIGWAEMVAIEMGLTALVHSGARDVHFLVHSDNTGVLGALNAGLSRSVQQNIVLRRIVEMFTTYRVWFTTIYIASASNPADGPSRGVFPPFSSHISFDVPIPPDLLPFLLSAP